ncbi:tRNA (cmo5U34)-methyltransferase [Thalassocella blandensis]|nr:tRNA (cmo5U34)-methyltransferase [Thalassocella blandensis]
MNRDDEKKSDNAETFFGKDHAKIYDKRWEKLGAINQCLYLQSEIIFQSLPQEARILCVGCGTGRELFYLAEKFPHWQFTALDTSEAMLDVCQEKAEALGVLQRVHFHKGYVESLPEQVPFDAATSFLVSQFYMEQEQRQLFFTSILQRLRGNGLLINCDLVMPEQKHQQENLMKYWIDMQKFSGLKHEDAINSTSLWNKHVAISAAQDIETMLNRAGFINPTRFFQAFFINAWVAQKSE